MVAEFKNGYLTVWTPGRRPATRRVSGWPTTLQIAPEHAPLHFTSRRGRLSCRPQRLRRTAPRPKRRSSQRKSVGRRACSGCPATSTAWDPRGPPPLLDVSRQHRRPRPDLAPVDGEVINRFPSDDLRTVVARGFHGIRFGGHVHRLGDARELHGHVQGDLLPDSQVNAGLVNGREAWRFGLYRIVSDRIEYASCPDDEAADHTRSGGPVGRAATSRGRARLRKCWNGLSSRKKKLSLVVIASTTWRISASALGALSRSASAARSRSFSRFNIAASRVSSR